MEDKHKKVIFSIATILIILVAASLIINLVKPQDIVIEEYVDIPSETDLQKQALLQELQTKHSELLELIEEEIKNIDKLKEQSEEEIFEPPPNIAVIKTSACEEAEVLEDIVDGLNDDLDDDEDDEDVVRRQIETVEDRLKQAIATNATQTEQDRIIEELEDLEKDLDDEQKDSRATRRELNDARVELNNARARCNSERTEEALRLIEEAKFDENICEGVIDSFLDFIDELDDDKDDAKRDLSREEVQFKSAEDFLTQLLQSGNATQSELRRADDKRDDAKDDRDDAKQDLEDLKDRLADARDKLKLLRDKCDF